MNKNHKYKIKDKYFHPEYGIFTIIEIKPNTSMPIWYINNGELGQFAESSILAKKLILLSSNIKTILPLP